MQEEYKGYQITIEQDELEDGPRTWDNLVTMYYSHRNYILGDEQIPCERGERLDLQEIMNEHRESESDIFMPLYLFDHSGLSISTNASEFAAWDAHGWDWGLIGFLHIPASKIRHEYSVKRITKRVHALAVSVAMNEVATYDQFISGDVYYYSIQDEAGEFVDSLCGMYGYDYTLQEAKEAVQFARKKKAAAIRADRLREREAIQFERLHFAI